MDLICGGQLPPEDGQSQMSESPLAGRPTGEVFPLHEGVVRGWIPKGQTVSLIIGTHADEIAAPGNLPLEMVNARRFIAQAGRLIVTAVFVKPRDGKGVSAAIVIEYALAFRNRSCARAYVWK
ncbi:MAG TPA: hypothetical protein VK654_12065 [Nitrospirota bacterium]|nr:hypothetical protein [Nitrospirota bacterium]